MSSGYTLIGDYIPASHRRARRLRRTRADVFGGRLAEAFGDHDPDGFLRAGGTAFSHAEAHSAFGGEDPDQEIEDVLMDDGLLPRRPQGFGAKGKVPALGRIVIDMTPEVAQRLDKLTATAEEANKTARIAIGAALALGVVSVGAALWISTRRAPRAVAASQKAAA